MELFNYQKYIGVIVFGYFAIKIYYNFLFENLQIKNANEELSDFSITIVLSSIVYLLTNFENVMMNPMIYYVGFLIGTQCVVFKRMFLDTIKNTSLSEVMFYMVIIIYTIVFVYFYILQNLGNSIINPLLVIISVISLVIGIILSTKKEIKDQSKNETMIISRINSNIGFMSFLGSLLMVHTSHDNIIVAFFQSILIGSFVSYFSYYKPEFIIDAVHEDKENDIQNKKIVSEIMTAYQTVVNDVKVNRIVCGLSYITILICITIMYVHYSSDLSN